MSGGKRVWRQPTDALSACAAGIAGMAVLWVVCGMTGWQLVRKVCVTPTWASASCCCCRALLRMWLLLVYTSGGPFFFLSLSHSYIRGETFSPASTVSWGLGAVGHCMWLH